MTYEVSTPKRLSMALSRINYLEDFMATELDTRLNEAYQKLLNLQEHL